MANNINNMNIDILSIAKETYLCRNLSLSHLMNNGNDLEVTHNVGSSKLVFRYTDNSKPYYYKELVENIIVDKEFTEKVKCISYDFPYYSVTEPAKMVASSYGLFCVHEYTLVKEHTEQIIDYIGISNLIRDTVMLFSK